MWRNTFGLSEAAAMNALVEDGVIKVSEHDQLARSLQETFGLSDAAAGVAARGRGDSLSSRPATPSVLSESWRHDPGDAFRVVRKIEKHAAELCRRGVLEEKALRDAAFAVFEAAPDSLQDWVAAVAGRRWPGLWNPSSSTGSNTGSSSGRTSGTLGGH
jgi:hypothetical protein